MMANHPNRQRFPFVIHLDGMPTAAFREHHAAHGFARHLSEKHRDRGCYVDVSTHDSLIGHYRDGWPTPEFRGRGDEHYPAGPRSPATA